VLSGVFEQRSLPDAGLTHQRKYCGRAGTGTRHHALELLQLSLAADQHDAIPGSPLMRSQDTAPKN